MKQAGIEKINIYGCTMYVPVDELAEARGKDISVIAKDYRVRNRSLNPLYEDAVTMAANAAAPILTDEIKKQIGLVIFGTESSTDFSKPASTHMIEMLRLPRTVKNFEVKHACFSGAAALGCALDWIHSGANRGKKALVLASDFSKNKLHNTAEFILGGCAAAVLVSDEPKIVAYEHPATGVWSSSVYDTFRPDARLELFNAEISLFTYIEALQESYRDYCENRGEAVDFENYFSYLIYHMPFPGMAFLAHRSLCRAVGQGAKEYVNESFGEKVLPSLSFSSQVGSTYGASNFIGLCGLITHARDRIGSGDRIGFFSYGSGAIGQFYSGLVMPDAVSSVVQMNIGEALAARKKVSVQEYERIENMRDSAIGMADYEPSMDIPEGLFETHYLGKKRLFLRKISQYERVYEWS